jgi:hypothetical protein
VAYRILAYCESPSCELAQGCACAMCCASQGSYIDLVMGLRVTCAIVCVGITSLSGGFMRPCRTSYRP